MMQIENKQRHPLLRLLKKRGFTDEFIDHIERQTYEKGESYCVGYVPYGDNQDYYKNVHFYASKMMNLLHSLCLEGRIEFKKCQGVV